MAKRYSLRPVKPVLTEIEQCLLEITHSDLSYREAQEKYGFPKSTLQRYMLNAGLKLAHLLVPNASLRIWNLRRLLRNIDQISLEINKLATLKKYVADVTAARGVTWLNCLPSDDYTTGSSIA